MDSNQNGDGDANANARRATVFHDAVTASPTANGADESDMMLIREQLDEAKKEGERLQRLIEEVDEPAQVEAEIRASLLGAPSITELLRMLDLADTLESDQVLADDSESAAALTRGTTAPCSWKELAGRATGADSYQFGKSHSVAVARLERASR